LAERAIFLDRDGVINVRRADHVKSWSEFEFTPDSLLALRELADMGERAVVVTNQSAVGRGLLSAEDLALIHTRMADAVTAAGGRIHRVYACPHVSAAGCGCRKPGIQLLVRAAQELGVELHDSVLVGDSPSDVEAALAAGCQPILVGEGGWRGLACHVPRARNLLDAVSLIRHIATCQLLPC